MKDLNDSLNDIDPIEPEYEHLAGLNGNKAPQPVRLVRFGDLEDRKPTHKRIEGVDLVIVRYDHKMVSVLSGRCLHRGALLSDGYVEGDNLVCGLHDWDYRIDTGISSYDNSEALYKFDAEYKIDGWVTIDRLQLEHYREEFPSKFTEKEYQGLYQDTHPQATEPYTSYIQELAQNGLKKIGKHGATSAMGVERSLLPNWKELQFLPAQLWKRALADDAPVITEVVIGPTAKKPLQLAIPLLVSDMSFGAISKEAKVSLSKGAELSQTGVCSGEGGMLEEEQINNSRYFYELASGKFGFKMENMQKVQAFHFKGGQGAKTGVGGHLPGHKVTEEIAHVRGVTTGTSVISPPNFPDLIVPQDFARVAAEVREASGGIPIGFKIAASHIEKDIDFALQAGADYLILDGRGGGTGAAPDILRNNINVPTMVALARARRHLNASNSKASLIITGGLRIAEDFAKALMLGADAIAIANSALQAIGCLGMRACHTDNCPVGIATQKPHLRSRLIIEPAAQRLHNFLQASVDLMKVIARACGHNSLAAFTQEDLTTFSLDIAKLTGVRYAGVGLG